MVVRVDFRVHDYSDGNKELSKLINKIRKHLITKYKIKNFGYIWAREKATGDAQHYHIALFLNQHKIHHPSRLLTWIEKYCDRHDLPKPFTPKNCFYHCHRGVNDQTVGVLTRLVYLAKTCTKNKTNPNTKEFGSSRVKSKIS